MLSNTEQIGLPSCLVFTWQIMYDSCFSFFPTNKSSIVYEKSLSWSQEENFYRYKIFKGRLYDWKQIFYLLHFTFQPFKRNILPSHNELLEKQLKTIIMSITITINNMFQPFKRNISFILYNNLAELNILFKNFKMKVVYKQKSWFFFLFLFFLLFSK